MEVKAIVTLADLTAAMEEYRVNAADSKKCAGWIEKDIAPEDWGRAKSAADKRLEELDLMFLKAGFVAQYDARFDRVTIEVC